MSEEDQLISNRSAEEGDRLAAYLRQKSAENAKVSQVARQKQEFEQMTQDPRFKDLPVTVGEYHRGGKPQDPNQGLKDFLIKQQYEQNQKQSEATKKAHIPGFNVKDPNYIPSEEDTKTIKKQAATTSQIGEATKKLQDAAGGAGYLDKISLFGIKSDKKEAVDSAISDLTLKLKNAEQLGAISGADMDLINKRIGRITGAGSLFKSPEEIQKEIAQIHGDYANQLAASAEVHGYEMQQPKIATPVSNKISIPKPGSIEDGHRYIGGNPADPNNWEKL